MSTSRTRGWLSVVVVVIVAALIGAGTVILFVDTTTAGATVTLIGATNPGTDPFTRSITIGETAAFPTKISPITRTITANLTTNPTTHTLTTTGNAPGLYGGTGNTHVCDPHQLADYLTHNPTKANAWAHTLGITTTTIPTYIATLTPVILTTDTRITNHGYQNGHATTFQAVLQAGTAVLIDHYGTPHVKCGCGNPLTPPTSQPITTTTGTPWPGYNPTRTLTITPTPQPQTDFTLTNINTRNQYTEPIGTDPNPAQPGNGSGNGSTLVGYANVLVQGEDPLVAKPFVISHDQGATWSPMGGVQPIRVGGIASGAGRYVAVSQTQVLSSSGDGPWKVVTTVPAELTDVAYGNGTWMAIGKSTSGNGASVVLQSTDAKSWTQIATIAPSQPGVTQHGLVHIAYGNRTWVILADEYGPTGGSTLLLTSADGRSWPVKANYGATTLYDDIEYGNGQWYAFGTRDQLQTVSVEASKDLSSWADPGAPTIPGYEGVTAAFGHGRWYISTIDGGSLSALLYTSTDGVSWSPRGPRVGEASLGGTRNNPFWALAVGS